MRRKWEAVDENGEQVVEVSSEWPLIVCHAQNFRDCLVHSSTLLWARYRRNRSAISRLLGIEEDIACSSRGRFMTHALGHID